MKWFELLSNPAVVLVVSSLTSHRVQQRHKKALKQIQTALWNDRLLRSGRMPGQEGKKVV